MGNFKKSKKMIILKRDGYTCQYCGKVLIFEDISDIHIDHIIPGNFPGRNELENLNTSCPSCNIFKSNKNLEEFRNYLTEKINSKIEFLNKYNVKVSKIKKYKFYFEKYGRL